MKLEMLYFEEEDGELCYTAEQIKERAEPGIKEIEVFQAIEYKEKGLFWCKTYKICVENSQKTCSKQCEGYKPKNGKTGCCKAYTRTLHSHGKKVILKIE
jgi:hypothetical protein